MRLIDADKIKRPLNMKSPYSKMMCAEIDNAPTIDAVEVVRCKDCKSYRYDKTLSSDETYHWCIHTGWQTEEWFCAGGTLC